MMREAEPAQNESIADFYMFLLDLFSTTITGRPSQCHKRWPDVLGWVHPAASFL